MMKSLINTRHGLYDLNKARKVAAAIQAGDEEWEYRVVDCKNGYGRIDVYDEDGALVDKGWLPE